MHSAGRKLYRGGDFRRAQTIEELRNVARRRVPRFAFEYVEGGAEDEATLHWNRADFSALRFRPATLVDTSARSLAVEIFGRPADSPLIIAPTGLNGMLRFRADAMLARAAGAARIPFTLSTLSNLRVEKLAAEQACERLWMQLYVFRDRAMAADIVARAERAGCEALVFTSDANVFGSREWDRRNYRRPGVLTLRKSLECLLHPRWLLDVPLKHGFPRFENVADFFPPHARSARAGVGLIPKLFLPDITWADVEWLRSLWPRRLLLKGVLTAADAQRAADAGCDGIIVSNHGGRQLDGSVTALDVLEEIAASCRSRLTIVADGGFRRGTDVVKALALGAHAVMLGRATLYGMVAGGEAGARHALQLLNIEIDRTLGQLGCNSIAELGPHLLQRRDAR